MAKYHSISPAFLRQCFDYDQETGAVTHKYRPVDLFSANGKRQTAEGICKSWNSRYAGKNAINFNDHRPYGYVIINYCHVLAHIMIWAYVHGEWPDKEIDHINNNPKDNRIENLRLATRQQNQRNIYARQNKRIPFKGVTKNIGENGFRASIRLDSKRVHLGYFKTAEAAAKAYEDAAKKYHGIFAKV